MKNFEFLFTAWIAVWAVFFSMKFRWVAASRSCAKRSIA